MDKKQSKSDSTGEGVSRRSFMKHAAAGAGAAAAAATATGVGARNAEAAVPDISRPDDFTIIDETPINEFAFPARGADVFARACKEEGLDVLFCCPGNYGIITSLAKQGIPTYGGRTEGPMTSAADAFCRVTGKVAAASGTEGPGFTNMICAIAAANAARSPLLVLASNMDLAGDDTEGRIQRGYQQPTTEGLKKYGKRLVTLSRVHEYAGYAFRQLKSGVPGPVHLDFVSEVAGGQVQDELDLTEFTSKEKYRTEAVPYPDPKQIAKAVDLIKQAKRPMIVASVGAFYSQACDAIRELAEKTNIPVTESGPQRGKIADDHPLCASMAYDAYRSVDLVILVGQYCMPGGGRGFQFGPDAKYIRIDPAHEEIGRNTPIDVGIVSCEKAGIEALTEALPATKRDTWVAEVQAATAKYHKENEERYKIGLGYSGEGKVHPSVIGYEIEKFLYRGDIDPKQTTVVSGGFGIGKWTRRHLRAYRPGQICNGAYQYGSIGPDVGYLVGCGVAVRQGTGYQKGYEGSPVLAVTGDAGIAYSGFEIETLAKYKIPGIVVVYNNNAWGTWPGGVAQGGRIGHAHLFQENLRYDKVAEALGGNGEYVRSPEEMRPALERAWKVAVNESRPSIINVQAIKEYWTGAYEFLGDGRAKERGMTGTREPGCESYAH